MTGKYDGQLYIIPDFNNIEESLKLASEYNAAFEYNDFFEAEILADSKLMEERIHFYQNLGRDTSRDTLHGAFFDVTIHSDDPEIRDISRKRVIQSMDAAKALGVRGVIFHTNFIPNFNVDYYCKQWQQRNIDFWQKILHKYPKHEVFIENMFDMEPDMLVNLARDFENMDGHDRIGVCFDYAHSNAFGDGGEEWMRSLSPYIKHMHINDNDRVNDLHLPMGDGIIDWQEFNRQLEAYDVHASVLVEIKGADKQRKSLEYMKREGIYPLVK